MGKQSRSPTSSQGEAKAMWATVKKKKGCGPEIITEEILKEKTDVFERDDKHVVIVCSNPVTKLHSKENMQMSQRSLIR